MASIERGRGTTAADGRGTPEAGDNKNLGMNLRRVRKQMGLTLDEVSKRTGVSKSMLSDIERMKKSPTVALIDRIVAGLDIPRSSIFSETSAEQEDQVTVADSDPLIINRSGYRQKVYFNDDKYKRFTVQRWEIYPHVERNNLKIGDNYWEYCLILKGQLTMRINGREYILNEDESIWFSANLEHTYINRTDETVELLMITHY